MVWRSWAVTALSSNSMAHAQTVSIQAASAASYEALTFRNDKYQLEESVRKKVMVSEAALKRDTPPSVVNLTLSRTNR